MAHITIPYCPRYPEVHRILDTHRFCVLVAHRRFGKTVLAINYLIKEAINNRLVQPRLAYVAPFRNQAKSVAWDYLKRYTASLPGRMVNESELSITIRNERGNAQLRLFGADNPDALRGLYFDAIVLDEVAQMKPDVWDEIVQPALADRKGKALFIGTPKGINLFSRLYFHAVEQQSRGNNTWAALCFPVDKTNALAIEEVERMKAELTENKFRQELLCDFTASSEDALITIDEVENALQATPDASLSAQWPLVVGVDVARFGDDATVIQARRHYRTLPPVVLRKMSNLDVAHRIAKFCAQHRPQLLNIDQGQGTGVIDLVRDICPNVIVNEIPFGSRATEDRKYVNRRCEMWTLMRDWLRQGGSLCPEYGEAYKNELTAPCFSYDAGGRIKLEPKEEIKKRLRHSTDIGDALALTFAVPVGPRVEGMAYEPTVSTTPYDPFAGFDPYGYS